jgi:hypothetical protein
MDYPEIPVTKPGTENLSRPDPCSFRPARLPLRVQVGIGVLILFVLVTNIVLVKDAHRRLLESKDRDPIMLYEKRYAELRQVLKPRGVVGYFTDAGPESEGYVRNFYLTQYELAPVIVTTDTDRQWVVGNFWQSAEIPAVALNGHLYLWKDFGNGVALFQRTSQ